MATKQSTNKLLSEAGKASRVVRPADHHKPQLSDAAKRLTPGKK